MSKNEAKKITTIYYFCECMISALIIDRVTVSLKIYFLKLRTKE